MNKKVNNFLGKFFVSFSVRVIFFLLPTASTVLNYIKHNDMDYTFWITAIVNLTIGLFLYLLLTAFKAMREDAKALRNELDLQACFTRMVWVQNNYRITQVTNEKGEQFIYDEIDHLFKTVSQIQLAELTFDERCNIFNQLYPGYWKTYREKNNF